MSSLIKNIANVKKIPLRNNIYYLQSLYHPSQAQAAANLKVQKQLSN